MIPSPRFYQQYFEYVVWADKRQLELVRQLPEAEYMRDRGFSFGSIHKILTHELSAQSVWLDRFQGAEPVWLEHKPGLETLAAVDDVWPRIHERGLKYMAALTPQKLAANLNYSNMRGEKFSLPLWELVFHMCQHSYYHRSQLNSMIKLAGGKPRSTDYATWVAERDK
ncbi:MAG TPA: DinB family protein [Tepidisphaeraceae bacterium]